MSDFRTRVVEFEFSAGAEQQWTFGLADKGFIYGMKSSLAVVGVSVNESTLTTQPNGGLTRVLSSVGMVIADGLVASSQTVFGYRHPLVKNDIIRVRVTAAGLVIIWVGYSVSN